MIIIEWSVFDEQQAYSICGWLASKLQKAYMYTGARGSNPDYTPSRLQRSELKSISSRSSVSKREREAPYKVTYAEKE